MREKVYFYFLFLIIIKYVQSMYGNRNTKREGHISKLILPVDNHPLPGQTLVLYTLLSVFPSLYTLHVGMGFNVGLFIRSELCLLIN